MWNVLIFQNGLRAIEPIMSNNGAIGGNRTHDLRLTKAPLYPLATMAQKCD